MPYVTLKFKIPEESEELSIAQNGIKYYCVLEEFRTRMRARFKYGETEPTGEEIRELFFKVLEEQEVTL